MESPSVEDRLRAAELRAAVAEAVQAKTEELYEKLCKRVDRMSQSIISLLAKED